MRLAIGTAQFGQPYGIVNKIGQVSQCEAKAILQLASVHGINTLDTATTYGNSEERLGKVGIQGWDVISKIPGIPDDCKDLNGWVLSNVCQSLTRLRATRLRGLLLHRPNQLLGVRGRQLYEALLRLKDAGKVEKIGISIYEPSELDALCEHYSFDVVQAPFNVFDRRLFDSGWMRRLSSQGVEIHVRSVFLQGLLLSSNQVPVGFEKWKLLWFYWDKWINIENLSPLRATLGHVLSYPEVSRVVVGLDSLVQLEEILACIKSENLRAPEILSSRDPDLLNPSRWASFLESI